MIQAEDFVEAARGHGFKTWAGVPCSFLKPFINYVIEDDGLDYYSCTNEGDAIALAAGTALAGGLGVSMMQNSGLGNAVSPLTSLTWTFRLPQLVIVTWRAQPGLADQPQHQLMGPITPTLLETMEIPWELFPTEVKDIEPALGRALKHMAETGRPYCLLMQKGTVADHPLKGSGAPKPRPQGRVECRPGTAHVTRSQALARIQQLAPTEGHVVLASTGYTGRELYALEDRPNQLYMVGSMGCISAIGLGLALARPDLKITAIDGDGSALMRLGLFSTLGTYGPGNLTHVVLDNGVHDSTGGQATVSAGVSFARIAAACGYPLALESTELEVLDEAWQAEVKGGTRFVCLKTVPGARKDIPRPSVTPVEVKRRLMAHIGAASGGIAA
ncbi:MAG: phosphonopyruvate decarboxylase [Sinobacteraceae bacterium]|nr:phosphonopyruvate decarboxylase [Nevskiaceae bacterium]